MWHIRFIDSTHGTFQILSITCDNAFCNDTMVGELDNDLPDFSDENRTRCFLHIINLVAKMLLKQFDVPKKDANTMLSDAERALQDLAKNIDLEESTTRKGGANDDGDDGDDDDVDGWVDEMDLLSEDEREDLGEAIRPVRLVLTKVMNLAHLEDILITTI